MCDKADIKNIPLCMQYVPDQFKTQAMSDKAVDEIEKIFIHQIKKE